MNEPYETFATLQHGDDTQLKVTQKYNRLDGLRVQKEEDLVDYFVQEYVLTPLVKPGTLGTATNPNANQGISQILSRGYSSDFTF